MYLTKIPLNSRSKKFMLALNSPNIFHGALESSFEGERKRRLWRIDKFRNQYMMLVLSEDIPGLESFCSQFECDIKKCETRPYEKLLGRIEDNSRWRFRLVATPTACKASHQKNVRGNVVVHTTPQNQKQWLIEKSKSCGFMLDEYSFDVSNAKMYRLKKRNTHGVSLLSVEFEGVLEVTDAELFRETLLNGIGREKAYGMGLLTIISVGGI